MSLKYYLVPLAVLGAGIAILGPDRVWSKVANTVQVEVRERAREQRGSVTEVREFTLDAGSLREVDAGPNGGINVTGWDRGQVQVEAKLQARSSSYDAARELLSAVAIETADGVLRATGPKQGRGTSWSVSFTVSLPHQQDLRLSTVNGGISVDDIMGNLHVRTTNGGIKLARVGGNVDGGTTNGGLDVQLSGDSWRGTGLDLSTTNGAVKLRVPADYNAILESETMNGRISVDFPVTVQGRINKRLRTELGTGGPTIRLVTTNGGVSITRQ